jgi:hypothetical protein
MNLPFILLIGRPLASWLVAGTLPWRSCYRRDFDWQECRRRVRLELNSASNVSHDGPGLNGISSPFHKSLSRSQSCRRSPELELAIARVNQNRKRFRIEPPVEAQHASL